MQVSYGNHQSDYFNAFNDAFGKLGFPQLEGLNSGVLIGYAPATATVDPRAATRSSSETAYLQEALRADIQIFPTTLGQRVLFDADRRATGVEVVANGTETLTFNLTARKEVIISAGTWHSPQILMLSGIGPRATLESFGIPVVSALEGVGQNAWDQPFFGLTYQVNVTTNTQIAAGNPAANAAAAQQYLRNQSGPLAGIGAGEALAWEKFPAANRANMSRATLDWLATFSADWPEVEYLPLSVGAAPANLSDTDNYLWLASCLLSTRSRGNTSISSRSVLDRPTINPNWLADPADAEMAVQSFLRLRQIAAASGVVIHEYQPGDQVQTYDQILQWLRDNGSYIYHPECTCKPLFLPPLPPPPSMPMSGCRSVL